MTTPEKRIAAGYQSDYTNDALERRASAYQPEDDSEVDRIKSIDGLSPTQRLAVGYHESARDAATRLNQKENQS